MSVVFFRQRHHVRGSSSHRTRQPTQTGQTGADILHRRAATGQKHTDLSPNVFITRFTLCFRKHAALQTHKNQVSGFFPELHVDALPPHADHAGPVRPGQQSRCPDATEASRHDRPQQESNTGQSHTCPRSEATTQFQHLVLSKSQNVDSHDVWSHCVFIGVVSKLQSET